MKNGLLKSLGIVDSNDIKYLGDFIEFFFVPRNEKKEQKAKNPQEEKNKSKQGDDDLPF